MRGIDVDGIDGIGGQFPREYAVCIDVGQLVRPAFRIGFRGNGIRHGTGIRTGFLGIGNGSVQRSGQCRDFTVSVFTGLRDGFAFFRVGIALGTAQCGIRFALGSSGGSVKRFSLGLLDGVGPVQADTRTERDFAG